MTLGDLTLFRVFTTSFSLSLSLLARTLNPYSPPTECEVFIFLMANGDLEIQHPLGNDLTLPQARLCTCPGMYVSRSEKISLCPCLTLSLKKGIC